MDRQSFVASATIHGIQAVPVTVEVSVGSGLPGISIVGLADSTVQESKLRVRSALRAAGYTVPPTHIVVNLAPSSLRKVGTGFDLPIAMGILACTGQIPKKVLDGKIFIGELSLDGSVRGVNGLFAVAVMASEQGSLLVSGQTSEDLSTILGEGHRVITNISTLRAGEFNLPSRVRPSMRPEDEILDYSDIASQDYAKRALQVAAAGMHDILMIGPPGSGKSMLAKRMPTIMPPLSDEERMESALIHSVAGLEFQSILAGTRPFRSPHHSATPAGLLGGGNPLTPGEVSLSHNGVLFLDEMAEFGSRVLQLLRQPMEDGKVVLARADGVYVFPSKFLLVGASNPCPCGYLGDPEKKCQCSEGQITRYRGKIGGPIMDRFDMMVQVNRSDPKSVLAAGTGKSSMEMREGVLAAREYISYRESCSKQEESTTEVGEDGKDAKLVQSCKMKQSSLGYLEQLAKVHKLSGRGIMKTLSVARTIADMDQRESVTEDDLAEAIMFRIQDAG